MIPTLATVDALIALITAVHSTFVKNPASFAVMKMTRAATKADVVLVNMSNQNFSSRNHLAGYCHGLRSGGCVTRSLNHGSRQTNGSMSYSGQMAPLPVTIRRSVLGIIAMVIAWFVVNVIVYYGLSVTVVDPSTKDILAQLAGLITVITGLVLILSIYLYWAASLTITATGLRVTRYKSLFWSIQSEIEWENVEEVTVSAGGILKSLFGVGTLLVQTASAEPNLAMNWVGSVDQVRDLVAGLADAAD